MMCMLMELLMELIVSLHSRNKKPSLPLDPDCTVSKTSSFPRIKDLNLN